MLSSSYEHLSHEDTFFAVQVIGDIIKMYTAAIKLAAYICLHCNCITLK